MSLQNNRILSVLLYRLGFGGVLSHLKVVILTTQPRASVPLNRTPLVYRMHGTKVYLIVTHQERRLWLQDIQMQPIVTLQAGPRTYGARAQVVEDSSETLRALMLFRKVAPDFYDALLARLVQADSVNALNLPEIAPHVTVVRLDLDDRGAKLPALSTDLGWVCWVAFPTLFVIMMLLFRKQKERD
ncbi:MAG: nitroreductase/quinone reductase family protein [Phototrophicaceae bacterium]